MNSIDLKDFLTLIWPEKLLTNELLELRLIDRMADTIRREFCPSIDSVIHSTDKYRRDGRYDIYFGVSTRLGSSGKKRDCLRTRVLWVDLDRKKLDFQFSNPKPDLVVDSGGGLHAYWVLKNPVLLHSEERWKEVEAINRGLAKKFGGDVQCADAARILRVPGTFNLKYQPKRPVKAYELYSQ